MANLADLLPTPVQTLVSTSYWANPYIEEARQFLPIILTAIVLPAFIVMIYHAFHHAYEMIQNRSGGTRDKFDDDYT